MLMNNSDIIPRYYIIVEDFRKAIRDGVYRSGDKLPTEVELCRKYGVSRGTVRDAMRILFQEGLLVRERGKGTFF